MFHHLQLVLALGWLLEGAVVLAREPYAPYEVACPHDALVRPAECVNVHERIYVDARKRKTEHALLHWLQKALDQRRMRLAPWEVPTVALALSGGGPKAGLTSAGVVQGLDGRDSATGVSGLLQGMTYMTALSGGSLTLTGMMANNFSLISALRSGLWDFSYQNPFLPPALNASQITADVSAKTDAGYPATLLDEYGRSISYDFINGSLEGGSDITWSGVVKQSSFHDYQAPFPILVIDDADVPAGQCFANATSPTYEVSPYEFGSWDPAVNAFFPTEFLGTAMTCGKPQDEKCTVNFDNAGFLMGISSNILGSAGGCPLPVNLTATPLTGISSILNQVFSGARVETSPYGVVPNPFYGSEMAGSISSRQNLYMQDGGTNGQGTPLMPLLQSTREIDVILAVDENSSGRTNVTSGASLYATYLAAQRLGNPRMPKVPDAMTIAAQNLTSRAQFFGCHDRSTTTVVFIPNTEETQFSSSDFFFSPAGINLVIQEGTDMVTQANSTTWPACLACGILHKTDVRLPGICKGCLETYCYSP